MIPFNINNYVKVKLTQKGIDIYYHRFDYLIKQGVKILPSMPDIDDQGFTKFQLWELISLYGHHLYCGAELPFDTIIYFEYDYGYLEQEGIITHWMHLPEPPKDERSESKESE